MKNVLTITITLTLFFSLNLLAQGPNTIPDIGTPSEVLVIVNVNSETSLRIGEYYMEQRGIPDVNLCILDCSTNEEIDREEFNINIRRPINEYLEKTRLEGRIKYLVTTYDVPLKIWDVGIGTWETYACAVDSELIFLDYDHYETFAEIISPYFTKKENLDRNEIPIYLVTRLASYNLDADSDGLPDGVKSIIDKSLFPSDIEGKFVLDVAPEKDVEGYINGNNWMREAASILTSMGADVLLDETLEFLVGEEDVIGYASWGSNDPRRENHGEPYFEWVNGAIATTNVSTNGRTFEYPPSYGQSMIADLIEEGISGACGNVYEPFIWAIPRPNILFPRYYSGYNLAESYYMSLEDISWMEVVVGDPLCAPFAPPMPRVYITTNRVVYRGGDNLKVDIDIWNSAREQDVRLYVALSIGDNLYFYPNWQAIPDFELLNIESKSRKHIDILYLELVGEIAKGNFTFYSAVTDTKCNLIGKLNSTEFEFR
ncbi:TIGR03790 family protein [bacterium]|nr:TIGR03790 family protein [bacterium]